EQFDVPVTTTLLAKGAVDETGPLALGMLGMHGTAYANKAILEADLLLNVGSRFDDRIVGDISLFGQHATIVHVDIDAAELGKMVQPDLAIRADAQAFLQALAATRQTAKHTAWRRRIVEYKQQLPLTYGTQNGLTQQQIIDEVWRRTDGQAIVATDVGQHQMWAAQFYKVRQANHWLSS